MHDFEIFFHFNNDYCVLINAQNLEEALEIFYKMPEKRSALTNTDCYISVVYESKNQLGPDGYPTDEVHLFKPGEKVIDPDELVKHSH